MTRTQQIVLDLLGQTLFYIPFDTSKYSESELDWNDVFRESRKQTVLPTVVEAVPADADEGLRLKWIDDCYAYERRGYVVLLAHKYMCELLKRNGIPFVILKGISSGSYYPNMHLRAFGDVDVLVPVELRELLKQLLADEGFTAGKELPFELDYEKNGVSYDIHFEVNGIPDGKYGDLIKTYMSDIIASEKFIEYEDDSIPVPDDFHHGMVLLLHTAKHMMGFGAGLRQLCDWAAFADYMGEAFPEIFEYKLKKAGLWKFAELMSFACVKYMHMPKYTWIKCEDDVLAELFMNDLMRKGNLRHDGNDELSSVLIGEEHQGGVAKSNMLIQIFKNLKSKVCYQWPVMQKHKILVPFGMIWMCIRYLVGVSNGTYKKTDIKGTIENANKRKALYEELAVFQEVE